MAYYSAAVLISQTDTGDRDYIYEAKHALWEVTDARGVTCTNKWNAFGEILEKSYSDGTPGFTVQDYTSLDVLHG